MMMDESLFSTYWYRVAKLKPIMRPSTTIFRHVYRNAPWYVLKNNLTGRSHRFNASAYGLIGQMDGSKTVDEIWENTDHTAEDDIPTQDEFIRLLGRLHDADLVQSDILPSTMQWVRNGLPNQKNKAKQNFSNPFFIRVPLFDPDRFLEKLRFLAAPAFTLPALLVWLMVVGIGAVSAVTHFPELSTNISDRLMTVDTLLMIWGLIPW